MLMYMTVTPGGLGSISKALSPLRDLVAALQRAQAGTLPDSNERRRLVRRVRSAGAAALPSLLRGLCSGSDGEAALAYYLLRRLGGQKVGDALCELLADPSVADQPKGRALGLLTDLGLPIPEGVTLEQPREMLAQSVRELCRGLRTAADVEETRLRILDQVAAADLPRFAQELAEHGGPAARPLLRALAEAAPHEEVRVSLVALLGDLEEQSPLPNSALSEALDYLEAGRPRAARLRIERHLSAFPDDAEAYSALGAALLELGERAAALRAFERALTEEPSEPLHLWNLAVAARRARRHGLATAILGRYLDCFDRGEGARQRRQEARAFLASMHRPPTRWDSAEEAADVLRVADRLFTLGTTELEADRPQRARDLFEDVIELLPGHYPSWGNLGACFLLLGRFEEARRCLDHALVLEPGYATARSNRALLDRATSGEPEALELELLDGGGVLPSRF